MDHEFIDKFGVPNKLEHFWMEGYHSMDRRLARHMFSVGHEQIPFPPVAGYAGNKHTDKLFLKIVHNRNYKLEPAWL